MNSSGMIWDSYSRTGKIMSMTKTRIVPSHGLVLGTLLKWSCMAMKMTCPWKINSWRGRKLYATVNAGSFRNMCEEVTYTTKLLISHGQQQEIHHCHLRLSRSTSPFRLFTMTYWKSTRRTCQSSLEFETHIEKIYSLVQTSKMGTEGRYDNYDWNYTNICYQMYAKR